MTDCLAATPHIIELEPILGAAIALNLAYLNIKKFEYIRQVRRIVKLKLDRLDPNVKAQVSSTKWFKQLESLSEVEADEDLPLPSDSWWLKAPGVWGFLFNLLFYVPIGRLFSIIGTAFCVTILLLAVGYKSGTLSIFACDLNGPEVMLPYYITAFSLIWPMLMISAGAFVGTRANAFVNYQTDQLKTDATADAKDALSEAQKSIGGGKHTAKTKPPAKSLPKPA